MSAVVFWSLVGLLVSALVYYIFALYAAWRFFQNGASDRDSLPPVSILKPLKGASPDLYSNLASFCQLDCSVFQIVCGVRDPDDPAISIVKKLQHDFPQCDITLVIEPSVIGANYKVSTLHHLMQQVKHDYVVITDSDVSVEPDYLSTIIPPLMSPDVGLVTCVYRAGVIRPFPALLESLMINTSFTTQVIVASQVEQPAYAFGATIAVKRPSLDAIGGFAALRDYLADDYYLGFLVAQAGYKVRILPGVVETHPDATSLKDLFQHQLRWARTQRNCRPSGHLGTVVTYGTVWACIGLMCFWTSSALTLLSSSVIGVRLLTAAIMSVTFLRSRLPLSTLMLIPLTDIISFIVWCASLYGNTVQWQEYTFRVQKDGRMVRVG